MATLKRALGRWDLTAIGINQVIGGAIFLMPSQVAAQIGALEPDRVRADGPRVARRGAVLRRSRQPLRQHRRTVSLHARGIRPLRRASKSGWMQWFTRAASQASVMAGIARRARLLLAGGDRRLAARRGAHRRHAALTWVNVRGIRQSAWLVNALTIGKLLPLALFIVVGLFYIEPPRADDAAADHAERSSRPPRC